MKKLKILLVLLISSWFFAKPVVADTTDVYFVHNTETWYDTTIFCNTDTIRMFGSTGATQLAFVSPDDISCETNTLLLIGDSVYYFDWIANKDTVQHVNKNGIWSYICVPGYNQHSTFFFTTPATKPWLQDTVAICGERDTLRVGDTNLQDGMYYTWEELGTGIVAEGYYPNDTSFIVDHTGDFVLTVTGGCDEVSDTIHMEITTTDPPYLGPDWTSCGEEPIDIYISVDPELYTSCTWQDGSTGFSYNVTEPGTYSVHVSNACITDAYDEIVIDQKIYPILELGWDQNICDGSSTTIDMGYDYEGMGWYKIENNDTIWINSQQRSITVDENIHLFAYATMYGCEDMMDDVTITVVEPYENNKIGIVTVGNNGHNKIVWEKTLNEGIESYNIYHLNIDYELIGNVSVNDEPVFYDEISDPSASAHRYKISAVDTCGNESGLSMYHGTIHITSTTSTNGGIDLTITDPYVDESGNFNPDRYYILIDSLNNGSYHVIDSMSIEFNSYYVSNPLDGASYLVGVGSPIDIIDTLGNKLPSVDKISTSNRTSAYVSINDINKSQFSVYPNPVKDVIEINFTETGKKVVAEIIDITGKTVLKKTLAKNGKKIDLSGINSGIYFIKLSRKNKSLGIQKIIKQ